MLYKGFWGANTDICPESEAQRAPKHLLNEDKWEHQPNLPKWEHQLNQQIKEKSVPPVKRVVRTGAISP